MSALVFAEHENGTLRASTLNAVAAAAQMSDQVVVLVAGVDAQLQEHGVGEAVLGEHALDGVGDQELGATLAHGGGGAAVGGADPAGVEHVGLVLFLGAGEADLVGVDHDDVVTGVDVGGVGGLVTAAENIGDLDGNTAQDLILGVDDIPGLVLELHVLG